MIVPSAEQIRQRLREASKKLAWRCSSGPYDCDSPAWAGKRVQRCDTCQSRDLIAESLTLLDTLSQEVERLKQENDELKDKNF